ncbi:hypothetical protein HPB51_029335 [Rhipicephalus microplus]|uniref:RPGR-interacting protein 1 first C2 domain-containing protein n=1 Tax=Rhipicephalus microplus TaxID=6941 RepID=A0A9J6CUW2_RHIMP|nr:hypothetical protein HPB51_029335 [Rhipicephalus microplus]
MGSARLDGDAFGRRSLEYDYLQLRDENVHLKKHAREQEEKAKKLATRLSRVINEKIKQGATASELGPRRQMVEMEQKVEDLDNKVRVLEKQNMQLKGKLQVSRQLISTATQFQSTYSKVQPRVNSGLRRPIQKPRLFGNESSFTAASLPNIEGSDVDENKWLEEAGALKLQITQLEAIIKSDNDEKVALEKELSERIELYQSLQEEHGNLEKAHAEITARLETVQKDFQDFQKETHNKALSMDKVNLPESSASAFGAMQTNGLSPSVPASRKQCLDKEVQATLLENGYDEMTKLKEEQQMMIEKERLRISKLQSLLTEKAKKIEVLEKHLAHIPSKQVQVTEVCAPNEADDEHCLSLVRKGQSFLEIHLNKITFVTRQDALENCAPPPVFATWTFADFQPQSTPVATGKCPEFNCTARYAVAVDSTFIDYLHKDSVQIQVQAVHGADIHSLGTCHIELDPALQHPFKCNYAQAALVGK